MITLVTIRAAANAYRTLAFESRSTSFWLMALIPPARRVASTNSVSVRVGGEPRLIRRKNSLISRSCWRALRSRSIRFRQTLHHEGDRPCERLRSLNALRGRVSPHFGQTRWGSGMADMEVVSGRGVFDSANDRKAIGCVTVVGTWRCRPFGGELYRIAVLGWSTLLNRDVCRTCEQRR